MAPYSSVIGGKSNVAAAPHSSISGGLLGSVQGVYGKTASNNQCQVIFHISNVSLSYVQHYILIIYRQYQRRRTQHNSDRYCRDYYWRVPEYELW